MIEQNNNNLNKYSNKPITIIVPLYNKVNEVCRAIDSIFAQTIQDFELIVVDGGSTDGSLDIIKQYDTDERFNLIHQQSKGVSNGRNEGILSASNNLIAFLDADDEWMPTFLEEIIELYESFPTAGIYATSYVSVYNNLSQSTDIKGVPNKPWKGIMNSYFLSTAMTMRPPFSPSCVAIPKTTFEQVGYFDSRYRIGEDTEFWGRVALSFPIAFSTNENARYYCIANNKATDTYNEINHHPFYKYIFNQPNPELLLNSVDGLRLYLEMEELNMAYVNLIAGNKAYVRENLKFVISGYFKRRKMFFQILSYMPHFIVKWMPIIKQNSLDKIRCYISRLKE